MSEQNANPVELFGMRVAHVGINATDPADALGIAELFSTMMGLPVIETPVSYFNDSLIEVMKHSKKICRHLHLPLQSGSTRILKAMNRRYTKEQYLDLVDRIRAKVPDISLTTDIIVGFPGETEEDFLETLDVVRRVRYDSAFTFQYSRRTGTPAAAMEDQIPADVVKDRFDRLLALVQEKGRKASSRFEGTVQEILVEEESREKGIFTGRTEYNLLVHFPGCQDLIGKYVKVKLDTCKGFYYFGSLAE